MNKILTTYLISAALGFASTLAIAQMAKADAPKFWYRHNPRQSSLQAPEPEKTGGISSATYEVTKSIVDIGHSTYKDIVLHYTISFAAHSADVQSVDFNLSRIHTDTNDTQSLNAQCANMICTYQSEETITNFWFTVNHNNGVKFSEDMRQDVVFSAQPFSYTLEDGTTVETQLKKTETRYEIKLEPEIILDEFETNAYYFRWNGDNLYFDENNKLIRSEWNIDYDASTLRIFENLVTKIKSK